MKADAEEIPELVTRLQRAVDKHNFGFNNTGIFLGISVGWASFGADGDTLDQLLLSADRNMYGNKSRRKAAFTRADAEEPDASYSTIM